MKKFLIELAINAFGFFVAITVLSGRGIEPRGETVWLNYLLLALIFAREGTGELAWFRGEVWRSLFSPRAFAKDLAREHYGIEGLEFVNALWEAPMAGYLSYGEFGGRDAGTELERVAEVAVGD